MKSKEPLNYLFLAAWHHPLDPPCPRYGEYHIFFSNLVRDGMIQQLAEADEHEVVQQVTSTLRAYLL